MPAAWDPAVLRPLTTLRSNENYEALEAKLATTHGWQRHSKNPSLIQTTLHCVLI